MRLANNIYYHQTPNDSRPERGDVEIKPSIAMLIRLRIPFQTVLISVISGLDYNSEST
jgi:hypothetical protein